MLLNWREIALADVLNIVFRVVLAISFLFIITKFIAKKNIESLTYFDYAATSILGTISGNMAFNVRISIATFVIALSLTAVIVFIITNITGKNKSIREFFAGRPVTIIEDGKILRYEMKNLRYSYDYLFEQLREANVFHLNQVKYAVLEANGKLSVKLKPEDSPLTQKDITQNINEIFGAIELIIEGKILENNLKLAGKEKEWLYEELRKRGIDNIDKISFAALSTNGKLYVIKDK